MSTLFDALANLEQQTHQIRQLALETASEPLAGRFTKAYLQGTHDIFSIIREAAPHERSLFSYIGEGDVGGSGTQTGGSSGGGGGEAGSGNGRGSNHGGATGNLVERRKPGLVTPLRNHHRASTSKQGAMHSNSSQDDPVKLLKTALTLVDE